MSWVLLTKETLGAALLPNWTVAPDRKSCPVIVTVCPPENAPELGETEEITGRANEIASMPPATLLPYATVPAAFGIIALSNGPCRESIAANVVPFALTTEPGPEPSWHPINAMSEVEA